MRVMNGLLNFTTEETKLFFSAKKRIWAFLCILGVLCGAVSYTHLTLPTKLEV